MKLQEYQSKKIFTEYGIPIQEGDVAETPHEVKQIAERLNRPVVIKSQVLVGGRGKEGGIKLANTPQEAYEKAKEIIGMTIKGITVKKVLVLEAITIHQEYYLSITIDRINNNIVAIASPSGGIDIEEVAKKYPHKITKLIINPIYGLRAYQARNLCYECNFEKRYIPQITTILIQLYKILKENDCELVEINPLAITDDNRVIAADAKIIIDDNALTRTPVIRLHKFEEEQDIEYELEKEAAQNNIPYVRLDGNIGIIGNGAGLVMATMDEIKRRGLTPANFLDLRGGTSAEVVFQALKLLSKDKRLKAILMNIFGGITRCDEVAKGIIEAKHKLNLDIPIVIRLEGTRREEGIKILKKENIKAFSSMENAADEILMVVQ